jgi:type IV pilus assembly protein PilB
MRRLGDILIEQSTLTGTQMEEAFTSKPRGEMIGD